MISPASEQGPPLDLLVLTDLFWVASIGMQLHMRGIISTGVVPYNGGRIPPPVSPPQECPRWLWSTLLTPPPWSLLEWLADLEGVRRICGSAVTAAREVSRHGRLWRWRLRDETAPWYGERAAALHSLHRDCQQPEHARLECGVMVADRAIYWLAHESNQAHPVETVDATLDATSPDAYAQARQESADDRRDSQEDTRDHAAPL
jgi:hypothetical protein